MRQLIRFKLDGNSLALVRNWDPPNYDREEVNKRKVQAKKLIERGHEPAIADRIAQQIHSQYINRAPVVSAFLRLKGPVGSHSSSFIGDRIRLSMNNRSLAATLEHQERIFRFELLERTLPKREVSVVQDKKGNFLFRYAGDEFEFVLRQESDGSVRLNQTLGGKLNTFKADSFEQLRQSEPKLFAQWLIPIFDHIGFGIPLVADDREVQESVLSLLVNRWNERTGQFKVWLRSLDDDNFHVREKASRALAGQVSLWAPEMKQQLESGRLSPEARYRLKKVLASATSKKNVVNELIDSQNLVNDPKYLVRLFKVANEEQKTALVRQLGAITEQSAESAEQWTRIIDNLK